MRSGEGDERQRLTIALKEAIARSSPRREPRDVPMTFSRPLLEAILAGRKTETRRPARGDEPPVAAGDRLAVRESWARRGDGFAYQRTDPLPAGVARWTPARFMPRDAARLFLTVVSVRRERLSAIDVASVAREGFDFLPSAARESFLSAWDAFYGEGEFRSTNDPLVWVICFARKTDEPRTK